MAVNYDIYGDTFSKYLYVKVPRSMSCREALQALLNYAHIKKAVTILDEKIVDLFKEKFFYISHYENVFLGVDFEKFPFLNIEKYEMEYGQGSAQKALFAYEAVVAKKNNSKL